MDNDENDTERKLAEEKFAEAQHAYQRGRLERALQLAQQAVEIDNSFNEIRHWMAERYVEMDQPYRASREYQAALRINDQDQEAWDRLEQVDPTAAARLKRLSQIAPDPFVAKRQQAGATDLGESFDELGGVGAETGEMMTIGVADEGAEDVGPDPSTWEFEQDGEFLQRWLAQPVVETMVSTIRGLWAEPEPFESVLALCAHGSEQLHPQLFAAVNQAAQSLVVTPPELYVLPERTLHPVLVKDSPGILAVPTRATQTMAEAELVFVIGRELGYLCSDYLAARQAVEVITERKPQLLSDCADTLREVLDEQMGLWRAELDAEALGRLRRLGHAWQQRAALSADRAGLLCCRDIKAATTAIAKMATPNIDQAAQVTLDQFLSQFAGQDAGQLAAIPVSEAPGRSTTYGAYRIQMLQWWATTAEYAGLREATDAKGETR